MFYGRRLLQIACVATPALAHAGCQNGLPLQSTAPPIAAGTVLFGATDSTTGLQQLFSFNTVSRTQTEISANWGLTTPGNPHVSPNGQYVVFPAIANNRWDIYIWQVGATNPSSLTGSAANLRYEDPAFTADGLHLVAKQNYNIVEYALDFSVPAAPAIASTTVFTTNGVGGAATEASGPSMSPDNRYIYFWRGSGSNENVHYVFVATKADTNYIPGLPLSYFPVVRDFSMQFVTGHATAGAHVADRLYVMVPNIKGATPTLLPFNDCNADNSDAAPVDDDYVLFSNDSTGTYAAYLGAIAAARAWDLSKIGLGIGTTHLLGMTYSKYLLTP